MVTWTKHACAWAPKFSQVSFEFDSFHTCNNFFFPDFLTFDGFPLVFIMTKLFLLHHSPLRSRQTNLTFWISWWLSFPFRIFLCIIFYESNFSLNLRVNLSFIELIFGQAAYINKNKTYFQYEPDFNENQCYM